MKYIEKWNAKPESETFQSQPDDATHASGKRKTWRIPYRLEIRPLKVPYYRIIGLAFRERKNLAPAVGKFIHYLQG